ncbi:MAG TPA: ribosome small subunit-dependent GTPase A [Casimicrobiaceae bacterium]|nr:ribosome small subunit-dependent GTPase A [Casimicrobiaceae bacterium]
MSGRRTPPRPVPQGPRTSGTVVAAFRRHWAVRLDDGRSVDCVLKGRSTTIAAGDRVEVAPAAGGGVVEQVLPRRNLIYRSDAFKEKLIAANVTMVIGVVAPDLAVDLELVDRWSVAAEAEGCAFVVCANKADDPGFEAFAARLAPWRRLGYEVLPLSAKHDVGPLRARVRGEHSVLVGQSGMGKSTIVNALVPLADARVGDVSRALRSGRHTTTESSLHLLPDDPAGGWIVDSPGMTQFALAHLAPDAIPEAFVELRPFLGHCRFRDCQHDREPGCAVQAAVARGEVAAHRVALMHALVAQSRAVRDPAR